jgi:hypothetical protein
LGALPDQPPPAASPEDAKAFVDSEAIIDPETLGDTEELDALPVLAGTAALEARPPEPSFALSNRSAVSVQAAAVAATGFVAGAATVAVLRRRRTRRALRDSRRGRVQRGIELVPVVASRSFLVDVHLLGNRD